MLNDISIFLFFGLVGLAYILAFFLLFTPKGQKILASYIIRYRPGIARVPAPEAPRDAPMLEELADAAPIAVYEGAHILDTDALLQIVSDNARAQARYDVVTSNAREALLALSEEKAEALILAYTSMYANGASRYGGQKMFLSYPDLAPKAFMAAWDDTYNQAFTETVKGLVAATVVE